MQDAATVLDVIGKRGARGLPVERLYRQMFNPQLFLTAFFRTNFCPFYYDLDFRIFRLAGFA
jgi:hypothetical protein